MRKSIYFIFIGLLVAACDEEANPIDQASADRGKVLVTENCVACHSINSHVPNMGPPLLNVLGRKAGKYADYDYSDGMKSHNVTWNKETLVTFIQAPVEVVPGTKMALGPLSLQEAEDIAEYLRSVSS